MGTRQKSGAAFSFPTSFSRARARVVVAKFTRKRPTDEYVAELCRPSFNRPFAEKTESVGGVRDQKTGQGKMMKFQQQCRRLLAKVFSRDAGITSTSECKRPSRLMGLFRPNQR